MPLTTDVMELLLKQQQEFMANILENQRKWFEENKNQIKGECSTNVPAFHAFNKSQDSWEIYCQQLEQHFAAYGVVDAGKKRAYLLSWSGSQVYELLQKLFGSEKIADKKYDELTGKLSEYFKSKVHVCTARHDFFKCRMKINQGYSEWIADLRGLARECKFVCSNNECNKEFVDEMIRDLIILHTPHDTVRTAALQKSTATLSDLILIAEALESTQKSLQTIKQESQNLESEINQIKAQGKFRKSFSRSNSRSQTNSRSQSNSRDKQSNKGNGSSTLQACSGCFRHHRKEDCKFLNATCHKCGRIGHIAPVCLSNNNFKKGNHSNSQTKTNHVYAIEEHILSLGEPRESMGRLMVDVVVNGIKMEFLLDTGASASIIGLKGFEKLRRPNYLSPTRCLKSYGSNYVPILGETSVDVQFNEKRLNLPLLITKTTEGDNIFGMNWAKAFGIRVGFEQLNQLNTLQHTHMSDVEAICSKFSSLFAASLGHCTSLKARLYLKENCRPKFFKSRPIPYSQLEPFKAEAKRMEEENIWKPLRFSEWAAPIVLVAKKNNKLRVCGDFKVTVNPQLEIDQYPIPRPEELFQKLAGGLYFSKIDMSEAYLQMELEEESKKFTVVNTPLGLFQFQRLPFGIASAPAIFQRSLEMILAGLECAIYLDDIVVTGRNFEEHLKNLEAVFQRLSDNGLRINRSKCEFLKPEVEYLGHVISAKGVHPSETGLIAIKNLPRPRNIKELQAFMGKMTYYMKFIRNFSQIAAPLNILRKKDTSFYWHNQQEEAFQSLKNQIVNATRLSHFRPELPVILATDASSHGIGAVISHINPDGSEQPIAFASKSLDAHQLNYSQIEKEALSIIFGVTKFNQYLYGKEFILVTDHKPLLTLFNPDKQLPTMTANRIQRWAIILMNYRYKIQYKATTKHANADALSRLPVGPDKEFDASEESCHEITVVQKGHLDNFPVNVEEIIAASNTDPIIVKVRQYIRNGWPVKLPKNESHLQKFFSRRFSLTVHKNVILLEAENTTRVIIPLKLQSRILTMLHEGHWGIVRTKQLARRYCWWPDMDKQIESKIRLCSICQEAGPDPPKQFSKWPEPDKAWQRIHIDFAGPVVGQMWLLCIDALSKFPFAVPMKKTTASETVLALTKIFTLEGLPEAIVSDNGPQFTSEEFQQFCQINGVQHIKTAPFHPASNGEAERFVRTFKTSMKKMLEEGAEKETALLKCLMVFRTTPSSVTGRTPAEILHGREHRTILSQIVPDKHKKNLIGNKQENINFQPSKAVFARNYARGPRWVPAKILSKIGSKMFSIRTKHGIWRRHINQLKAREETHSTDNFILARGLVEATATSNLQKPYLSEDHVESYSENTSISSSKDKSRSSVKTDSKEKEKKHHSKSKDRKKGNSREKFGGHVERNRESRHDYDRRERGPVHRSRLKHRDNCERRKHDNGNGRSDGDYYCKEQQNNEKSSNFPASHKHSRKRRSSRSKSREHPPSNKVGTSSSNFNEDRPNNNRLYSNRPNSQETKISIEASNSGASTSLPKYYNPSAININKYAEQVEKRKLLWSNKKSESNANKWGTPKFAQDTDGKVASKFMRLMGIKSATKSQQSKSETIDEVYVDGIKKREEMFSCMEQQYEVARQATHSMRGVGLGFSSQPREF